MNNKSFIPQLCQLNTRGLQPTPLKPGTLNPNTLRPLVAKNVSRHDPAAVEPVMAALSEQKLRACQQALSYSRVRDVSSALHHKGRKRDSDEIPTVSEKSPYMGCSLVTLLMTPLITTLNSKLNPIEPLKEPLNPCM